jgi:prepilin-type N-terminal cleavage/methylation domain-containing protein
MRDTVVLSDEHGFTLIELVIAIVVIGILSAVAIVGIASLTSRGGQAACTATADSAKAAAAVHYANTGAWPTSFGQMTGTTPKELDLPSGVTGTGTTLTGPNGRWTLTLQSRDPDSPNFACS